MPFSLRGVMGTLGLRRGPTVDPEVQRAASARDTERLIQEIRADEEQTRARRQREAAKEAVDRDIARQGYYWPSDYSGRDKER